MSGRFNSIKSFLERFPHVSNISRIDVSDLVKTLNSSLENFSDGYCLVNGSSHSFKDNFFGFFVLEQTCSIRDVVSHFSLSSNSNFILVN